jgi:fructokinase
MAARWGVPAEDLPADHPAWAQEAAYLADAIAALACVLSPRRVVMGGGVMEHAGLLDSIRQRLHEIVGGYTAVPEVVTPALGSDAGVMGALAAAQDLLAKR